MSSSSSSTSASSTPALIAQSHRATWNLRDRMTISLVGTIVVTTILFLVSTPAWHVYMVDFWMYDLPPLRPEVRIAAYLGIFLIAWFSYFARPPFGDSPLQAPELYAYTLPSFFSLEGVMAVVGKRWLSVPLLHVLRAAVIASMFCCMIGFGGHYPPIIAGLGTLVLHGVVQGCIGTSHRWYVPVYSLFALMFANGNQYWSVDALLASHLPPGTYPFAPYTEHALPSDANFAPVLVSGFARKYILVLSIFTLFFGGITKFLNSGVAWMNGNSLAYYVSSDENGRSMLLKDIMHRFRSLSLLLSFASIVLELGAIAAVFSTLLRPIILASAAAFHFGIWLTMWPNYFPQTYCYGLGQSWFEQPAMNHLWTLGLPADPALASRTTMLQHLLGGSSSSSSLLAAGVNATTAFGAHAGAAAAAASAASLSVAAGSLPDYVSSTMFAATAFATVSCIFLSFVTMLRIEYWPFTGVPMYSFYRDYSYNYKFLRDAKQAQEVALEHMLSGYPNALAWSNLWVVLRLKNVDPVVQRDQEEKRKQRAAAAAAAGAGSDAQIKATLAQSDAEKKENKESSERLFVNLKNRATNMSLPHGVLSKQWRRTLHNIAAKDMAMKPFGRIEADDATESVGTQWLREQRDALRQAGWALPEWADRSGELQLRVKLTEGYAVLAKVPWDPKLDKGAETKKQQ